MQLQYKFLRSMVENVKVACLFACVEHMVTLLLFIDVIYGLSLHFQAVTQRG